jgi:8-oxo-dGTP pyrophosphatase MutT (NUDIX family)
LIQRLQKRLEGKLPGIKSWNRMAVKSRKGESIESESLQKYRDWISKDKLSNMRKAAVLIGLFKKNDEWCFSLIRRPMNEKNHPGQIALPGGAMEKNETLMNTALREAFEEVGINPEDVEIIGQLTPIPVPVSEYLIYPFVGVIDYEPEWVLNEDEVEELLILKMSELISSDNGYTEMWDLRGNKVEVPIFKVMNETVWGATAAVLSELIDIAK